MKTIQTSKFMFLAYVVFLSCTISCSDSVTLPPIYPPAPENNDITIGGVYFYPTPKTVKVNTTVTWVNLDYNAHTVTSDSLMFDSGKIPAYSSFNFTFTTKGTYSYHCKLFGDMKGIIVVE